MKDKSLLKTSARVLSKIFYTKRIPMGVFTIEYETVIRPKLESALVSAVENEVTKAALNSIEESAKERIYDAYEPKFNRRRYTAMSDDEYNCEVSKESDNEVRLRITYVAPLQNLFGREKTRDDDLGDIIATGEVMFFMPFPRPWMGEGVSNAIETGEIGRALKEGLSRQGF